MDRKSRQHLLALSGMAWLQRTPCAPTINANLHLYFISSYHWTKCEFVDSCAHHGTLVPLPPQCRQHLIHVPTALSQYLLKQKSHIDGWSRGSRIIQTVARPNTAVLGSILHNRVRCLVAWRAGGHWRRNIIHVPEENNEKKEKEKLKITRKRYRKQNGTQHVM